MSLLLTSISDTTVAMHAVKLLTFHPIMNPVLKFCEQRCDGQKIFEMAADEFIVLVFLSAVVSPGCWIDWWWHDIKSFRVSASVP